MTKGRSSNEARMPQLCNGLAPEDRADILRVRPQGALCTDYQLLCQTLAPERPRITQIITGGARGADQLGYRWAWKHAIRHQVFRADWERFGKSAGIRRNLQMAQEGDVLVAFWDGQSPGTRHMIACMEQ